MSQLVKGSTTIALDSEYQHISPAETGLLDWERYFQSPGNPSENDCLQLPGNAASGTVASDRAIGNWMFSNVTMDWEYLSIPFVLCRFSPDGELFNRSTLPRMRRTNWGAGEWAGLSPFSERTSIFQVGTVSIASNQGYPASERSTQTGDSALLLEEQLVSYFDKLVNEAADEVFSDGMNSLFSRRLALAIETYGDVAVRAIGRLLSFDRADVETVGEILRQIGFMEAPWTHHSRLTILTNSLQSPDPRIRDAASLGLAALDDSAAIGPVRRALDRESSSQLRRNLGLVMDQLLST